MKISKLTSIFGSSHTSERMNRFAAGFDSILTLARGLYSSSETLQKIVVKETEAVNRSSSALEEISSMVGKTSSDTNQLNQLTHSAREAVNDGQKAIQEVTHGLHQIQSGTKELSSTLAKRMTELETVTQRLNEIKSKTTLIDDIAFQTKLLAFNASVEAARAGEHGKGFAVVAQEMANLAITSGKASQEISQILATGLSSTNQIVAEMKNQLNALMEKAMKDVEVGIESGSQGAMAFSKIVNEVDSVATLTQSIFQATQEQAIGIKEINFAVHQLSDTSQQLKSVADGTLQSALKLAEQTEEQSKTLPLIANDCGVTLKPIVKPFDFAAAVSAHLDWKMKLTRYLAKPDGSLVPEKVCLDNACALGKWIYGDGQAHKMLPTHESLRTAHASFHQVAADIIKAIDSKQTSQAEKLLAPGGIYMETSERCVGLIKKLQQEVEGGQSKIAA